MTRRLQDCPAVLLIVYTLGAAAEAGGYEDWLVRVDNPFFNAIPGVRYYDNWKIEQVLHGAPLGYTHFDFQGLAREADLEPVWFNPSLDGFRTEWIRLWGYAGARPTPVVANTYLMRPAQAFTGTPRRFARIAGGCGEPPDGYDAAWRIEATVRKHFVPGYAGGPWRVPTAQDNPLGLDWLALRYGDSVEELAAPGGEPVAFVARLIAAPA